MRNLLSLLFVLIITSVSVAQEQKELEEPVQGPKIVFEETSHNFGDITQGDVVEHVFSFKNAGTEPLVLSNVQTTCGCTAPSWPRTPIAPGETAAITVKFNSRGKVGMQNKVITVSSNSVDRVDRIKIITNVTMPESNG